MTSSASGSLSSPTCWWGWVTGFSTEPRHSSRPSAPVPSPSPNPTDTPTQHHFQNFSLKIWHQNHAPPPPLPPLTSPEVRLDLCYSHCAAVDQQAHLLAVWNRFSTSQMFKKKKREKDFYIHFSPTWGRLLWYWLKRPQLRGIDPSDAVIFLGGLRPRGHNNHMKCGEGRRDGGTE